MVFLRPQLRGFINIYISHRLGLQARPGTSSEMRHEIIVFELFFFGVAMSA
jgi:hypothetical protein